MVVASMADTWDFYHVCIVHITECGSGALAAEETRELAPKNCLPPKEPLTDKLASSSQNIPRTAKVNFELSERATLTRKRYDR